MRSDDRPDLSVSLTVGGDRLYEHVDESADDPPNGTCTCYVEVEPGSHFAVEVTAYPRMARDPEDILSVKIRLDGKRVMGRITRINKYSPNVPLVRSHEGRKENTEAGLVIRKFTFAHLETNDGPVDDATKNCLKNLGEVTVQCYWGRTHGPATKKRQTHDCDSSLASAVSEKCLKGRAISNRATLGEAELRKEPAMTTSSVIYPYGNDPFSTFTFKYRSRRDLQIEGIIPRSPSPVPLEERDPATLSREEAIELLNRRNLELEKLISVKREKRERPIVFDDDDAVEIAEKRSKRRHVSDYPGIEVFDLTEE